MSNFDVTKHNLVPKHAKISDKEKRELLEKYSVSLKELPKILLSDPVIQELGVQEGDIIKISRLSPTAGETVFYRRVVKQ